MNQTASNFSVNASASSSRRRKKSNWTPLGIVAMVLGFMLKWYVGLAVLAYILWGGRVDDLVQSVIETVKGFLSPAPASSGNAAFDAYKAQVLRDLEEEQKEFDEFVEQLRQARDRDEFERFMKDRKKGN